MKYELLCGDSRELFFNVIETHEMCVCVCDPPFNIGYHYKNYSDNMDEDEYYQMLSDMFCKVPTVVVHYPEQLHKLSIKMGKAPDKVVSWVYNSNTRKQHRDIAFYGISPDFNLVTQPYKNQNDKRIQALIAKGRSGSRLYDWWNVNQVKNVSKEKTKHPCQMPLEVMENIIGILPDDVTIIDPFMGSGTTGVACAKYGRKFIGIEMDSEYFDIAKARIENAFGKDN